MRIYLFFDNFLMMFKFIHVKFVSSPTEAFSFVKLFFIYFLAFDCVLQKGSPSYSNYSGNVTYYDFKCSFCGITIWFHEIKSLSIQNMVDLYLFTWTFLFSKKNKTWKLMWFKLYNCFKGHRKAASLIFFFILIDWDWRFDSFLIVILSWQAHDREIIRFLFWNRIAFQISLLFKNKINNIFVFIVSLFFKYYVDKYSYVARYYKQLVGFSCLFLWHIVENWRGLGLTVGVGNVIHR